MAEITNAGYQDLRDHMQSTWKYIELRDDKGDTICRLSPDDPRVTWTHAADAQVLELSIVIKGSDAEVNLPQKFNSSVVFNVPEGGEPLTPVEEFTLFEMVTEEDQITVRHRIEVPQVV